MQPLAVDPHPLLDLGAFVTTFPAALAECPSPDWLTALLSVEAGAGAPLARSEACRAAVRDLLRHGGYKPTGRGKPACEYLVRAAGEGLLGSINLAVDACNVVSLHSGLPISVVDLDRAVEPLRVGIAAPQSAYVFNASGQEIDLRGLVLVARRDGAPVGNPVKDSMVAKTTDATENVVGVVYGTRRAVSASGMSDLLGRFARGLVDHAGAAGVETRVLP